MTLLISICLCNFLLGEGLKEIVSKHIEADCLNCFKYKDALDSNPDLLIADLRSHLNLAMLSSSDDPTKVLLIETGCMPHLTAENLASLINHGVVGIVPKDCDVAQFEQAIKRVITGELWFERKKLRDVISKMNSGFHNSFESLTKREKEVVKLICKGYRNKEIMETLQITEQAVKSHLNRIYRKVGVNDRLQLALYVTKHWPQCL